VACPANAGKTFVASAGWVRASDTSACAGACQVRGCAEASGDDAVLNNPERCADALKESAVVADDKERALAIKKESLKRFAGINIEVVGWLVEQQKVCGHQAEDRELQPAALTAGEHRHLFPHRITAEEKLCKVRSCFGDFNGDSGTQRFQHRCAVQPCCANLGKVARHHATSNLDISAEDWEEASDGLEQCGLTCAVGTDDSNPLAATKGEAARTSDLNLRRLAIADGCLAESQRFGWATPSPLSSDRE
jgi:hypothetical protein